MLILNMFRKMEISIQMIYQEIDLIDVKKLISKQIRIINPKLIMYLSQPKSSNLIKPQYQTSISNKQNIIPPSKVSVFPPKIQRVSSASSNLYQDESIPKSFSKDNKAYRVFSKDKEQILYPKSTINASFNAQPDMQNFFNKDLANHRYSCNIDNESHSDNVKHNGTLYSSCDRRTDVDLEGRVKQLEDKMRKNQQHFKWYSEEIQHFKLHLSSSSSSSALLDSINTNAMTGSTREPLKQTTSYQNLNSKQNYSKNILFTESVTNSPKDHGMQTKFKQIDLIKKQIKKILKREEASKGNQKIFHDSIKQMLSNFRDYLQKSIESLTKRQEKNKKKIFDQISEEVKIKFQQIQCSQTQMVKKTIEDLRNQIEKQRESNQKEKKISISKERFLKNPILIKVKEEIFGLVKRTSHVPSFQSYVDVIKRNMSEAMGKQSTYSSLSNARSSYSNEIQVKNQTKISLQQAETTYYIDEEGYLLDSEGYYLLCGQQKIKLSPTQLQKLRQCKIMPQTSSFN